MSDVTIERSAKMAAVIERAHAKMQAILTDAGIEPVIARSVAAERIASAVVAALPTPHRLRFIETETAMTARMAILIRDISRADLPGLDSIPLE